MPQGMKNLFQYFGVASRPRNFFEQKFTSGRQQRFQIIMFVTVGERSRYFRATGMISRKCEWGDTLARNHPFCQATNSATDVLPHVCDGIASDISASSQHLNRLFSPRACDPEQVSEHERAEGDAEMVDFAGTGSYAGR